MERVLSYGDILLRRRDVDLLTPPNFINDNIIDFFLSYLSSSSSGSGDDDAILMVSPSTSFWILNCPDPRDLAPSLAPLHLHRRRIILFPVNDGAHLDYSCDSAPEEAHGSHWSLLVFVRHRNLCLHFDSMGGANDAYARALHAKVVQAGLLGTATAAPPRFLSAATPQQRNGFDCGAYVMAAAVAIKKGVESAGDHGWEDVEGAVAQEVSAESVSKLRESTMELIESLRKEQETKA